MSEDYRQLRQGNQRFWRERARTFGMSPAATATSAWVRDATLRYLGRLAEPTDRILEVGCGNGNLMAPLTHRCQIFGIDLSEEMLDLARAHTPALGLVRGDAVRLPFRDQSFDLVFSSRCLINIPDRTMQHAALDEMFRLVRPGGTVVLSENFEEPMDRLEQARKKAGLPLSRRPAFVRLLNLADILDRSAAMGWQTQRVRGFSLGHFYEEILVRYLASQRGGATFHRFLAPLTGLVARADVLAGRLLPLFGQDTTITLTRPSAPTVRS